MALHHVLVTKDAFLTRLDHPCLPHPLHHPSQIPMMVWMIETLSRTPMPISLMMKMETARIFSTKISYKSAFTYYVAFISVPFLLCSDYAPDARLDTYSNADIDDEGEYDDLSAAARRAAEKEMERRDRRRGRGARAARRSRAPAFLQDDDDDDDDDPSGGLLAGMKKRTRKQYDEREDIDDAEGADDVGAFPDVVFNLCS